jgi:hypothetical protein
VVATTEVEMPRHCTYRQESLKLTPTGQTDDLILEDGEEIIDVVDLFDSRTYVLIQRCVPIEDALDASEVGA